MTPRAPRPEAPEPGLGESLARAQDEKTKNPYDGDFGTNVTAYLLGGPLTFGGGAWLVDHFLLDADWLVPVGVLVGVALAVYVIWLRYGTQ